MPLLQLLSRPALCALLALLAGLMTPLAAPAQAAREADRAPAPAAQVFLHHRSVVTLRAELLGAWP